MQRTSSLFSAVVAVLSCWGTMAHAAKVGDAAPSFAVQDSQGKQRALGDFKGKYVVLEWHNEGCPFVKKHYDTGNMQRLQKEWEDKGVVWLTVISSAPGKEGFADAKAANADMEKHHAAPTAVLLDPKGEMGKAYGAKTTPHMFVIGPDGKLIYNGAIDDKTGTQQSEVSAAHNYVSGALTQAMAGQPVTHASTQPYGCGVKYP